MTWHSLSYDPTAVVSSHRPPQPGAPDGGVGPHASPATTTPLTKPLAAPTVASHIGRGGRASSAEGSCPQSSLPTNSHPSDTSGPTARRPTGPPSSPASLRGGVGPQTHKAHAALPTTPVHTPQTIRMEGRPPRRAGARSPSSSPKQGEWVTAPTVPCVGHGFDGVGAQPIPLHKSLTGGDPSNSAASGAWSPDTSVSS